MARRMVEVLECDVCGSAEGVVSYTVTSPVGTSEVDLCSAHRATLEELFDIGRVRRRPGRRPRGEPPTVDGTGPQKRARPAAARKATGRARKTAGAQAH